MTENNSYTLITGACGGLGRAFVELLLDSGENLVLIGTSQAKLAKLEQDFAQSLSKVKYQTFVMNLADSNSIDSLISFLNSKGIVVGRLINNAGLIIEGDFERHSEGEIIDTIKVNCEGTLALTLKLLKNRDVCRRFEILTVASLASRFAIPHMGIYAATKSFLVSAMLALAEELKDKNVVVSTICPGAMATTDAMRDSIKSMGLGGKLSCVDTAKVAKAGLKALKKKKRLVTVGGFNKFLNTASAPFSRVFMSKIAGKIYYKSQKKRHF